MSYLPDSLALDSDVALGYSAPNHYHGSALVVDAPVVAPYLWVQPAPPWGQGENPLFEFAYLHTPSADLDGFLKDYDPPADTLSIDSVILAWEGGGDLRTFLLAGGATYHQQPVLSSMTIYAVSYTLMSIGSIGETKRRVLGVTNTLPDGSFSIEYSLDGIPSPPVFVVAVDQFGEEIVSSKVYNLTETIRPPSISYIGLVYRCTVQGNVGATFPDWSSHSEGNVVTIGTAQFRADKYNQPLVHGALYPVETT